MRDERRVPTWLYRLRRLFRTRFVPFDGFSLLGYGHGIPKGMVHSLARGDYENPERRAVKAILRPGDRVLDIGACMGVVSLTAARIVGAANVVAFEPNPQAATVARANFERNGLPVRLVQQAVGAAAGQVQLGIGRGSWLGGSVTLSYEGGYSVAVEVAPIAELVEAFRPTVLVMDAEGFEGEILPACPLGHLRAVVVEFHAYPLGAERVAALRRLLQAAGFGAKPGFGNPGGTVSTEVWERQGVGPS
jgi:FkbM family methyltransferase